MTAQATQSCARQQSLAQHQALQGSKMHSLTCPYLRGKEKYLLPDLQRICSHWIRSRNADSSNPSTMSWKKEAGVSTRRADLPEDGAGSSLSEASHR